MSRTKGYDMRERSAARYRRRDSAILITPGISMALMLMLHEKVHDLRYAFRCTRCWNALALNGRKIAGMTARLL